MSKRENLYSWVCQDVQQFQMVNNMAPNMNWTNTSYSSDPHTLFYIAYNQAICYSPKSAHDYSMKHVKETSFPLLVLSHNSILNHITLKYPG